MGSVEQPVNIWYWRSDRGGAEDLAAGGFGSTTALADQSVTASAMHGNARRGNAAGAGGALPSMRR